MSLQTILISLVRQLSSSLRTRSGTHRTGTKPREGWCVIRVMNPAPSSKGSLWVFFHCSLPKKGQVIHSAIQNVQNLTSLGLRELDGCRGSWAPALGTRDGMRGAGADKWARPGPPVPSWQAWQPEAPGAPGEAPLSPRHPGHAAPLTSLISSSISERPHSISIASLTQPGAATPNLPREKRTSA